MTNVTGVTPSEKPTVLIISICSSPHCLAVLSQMYCFWATLNFLIASFPATAGSYLSRQVLKTPPCTVSPAPNVRQTLAVEHMERLAAKEINISLSSW